MAAAGKVRTGFSHPVVAKYVNTSGTISYTGKMVLARGVDVSVSPSTPDNKFYADNALAETANYFTNGTFTLTVDGLLEDAELFIQGISANDSDWNYYDDNQANNYYGLGFITRYICDGVTTYVPTVLLRVTFDQINESAATQEQDVSFQTQSITGKILRSEATDHPWKAFYKECSTEADAITALEALLA